MAIDMRHSKLTPEEAALLAGEMKKPNWQSKNEGIHERVSFEDSIWGFDLAGGAYYKTPLRVVGVKKGSRAEKAGIRLGDKLKRINDIETSTLTIQEAHEIIIESGVHLKIAVTAPEDEEDAYFCYEDPTESGYDSDEERRRLEEKIKKRQIHAKVSSYWSLQWPWVSKRRVIYRESNCFMVPSKYESSHKEKFPSQPFLRVEDDVVLQKAKNAKELEEAGILSDGKEDNLTNGDMPNGDVKPVQNENVENQSENICKNSSLVYENGINQGDKNFANENTKNTFDSEQDVSHNELIKNSTIKETLDTEEEIIHDAITEKNDKEPNKTKEILDFEEDISHHEATEDFEKGPNKIEESSDVEEIEVIDEIEHETSTVNDETCNKIKEILDFKEDISYDEVTEDFEEEMNKIEDSSDNEEIQVTDEIEDKTSTVHDETSTMNEEDIKSQEDEVIKGILVDDGDLSTDDDRLLDSILSDGVDDRRNNGELER